MKKHTDKIDDKKKASEVAIERWENEGGEALPKVLIKREQQLKSGRTKAARGSILAK